VVRRDSSLRLPLSLLPISIVTSNRNSMIPNVILPAQCTDRFRFGFLHRSRDPTHFPQLRDSLAEEAYVNHRAHGIPVRDDLECCAKIATRLAMMITANRRHFYSPVHKLLIR